MPFNVDRVRAEYPALREGYAHFDSAAGTLVAARCADAIAEVLGGAVGNKATSFEAARRSLRIVAEARNAVADLLRAAPEGVVFGPSATALTYLVARTLAAGWGPGDEVVVSRLDHDANVRPWVQAASRRGATVRWARVDLDTGELPADQYADLINDRTRIVAVCAASNAIGTRPDVPAIAALAHAVGALVYVDGVHATPHAPTNAAALGADFYVTSAYKWSGPHIAACVADPQLWERLHPEKLAPSPESVPERFEFGTLSFELLAGVTGAVDHLAGLRPGTGSRADQLAASLAAAQSYEEELFGELVKGLDSIGGVTRLPAPAGGCPTVSFRVRGQHPEQVAAALGDLGICVYAGDNYAYEYFTAMGLREQGSAVRASVYHYTTRADVTRLLEGLARVAAGGV